MDTRVLGAWGEEKAAQYLSARGLYVVHRHYRQKWGEIDLVCRDDGTWVFVEVKTRTKHDTPSAVEAISARKRQRLILAALSYMKWKRLDGDPMRFDLVLIESGEISWVTDAFPVPSFYTC